MSLPMKKKGHTCCGCCCDVRRATIIAFSIQLVCQILAMIFNSRMYNMVQDNYNTVQDYYNTVQDYYNKGLVTQDYMNTFEDYMNTFEDYKNTFEKIKQLEGPHNMWFYTSNTMIIVFYIFAIYGAIVFNMRMVRLTAQLQILQSLYTIYIGVTLGINFSIAIAPILLSLLFTYPPIMLFKEMKEGIMTRETYKENEEYSCCCV